MRICSNLPCLSKSEAIGAQTAIQRGPQPESDIPSPPRIFSKSISDWFKNSASRGVIGRGATIIFRNEKIITRSRKIETRENQKFNGYPHKGIQKARQKAEL